MKWLDPIVHIVFTFSETLGEGIALVRRFVRSFYRSPMYLPRHAETT